MERTFSGNAGSSRSRRTGGCGEDQEGKANRFKVRALELLNGPRGKWYHKESEDRTTTNEPKSIVLLLKRPGQCRASGSGGVIFQRRPSTKTMLDRQRDGKRRRDQGRRRKATRRAVGPWWETEGGWRTMVRGPMAAGYTILTVRRPVMSATPGTTASTVKDDMLSAPLIGSAPRFRIWVLQIALSAVRLGQGGKSSV